MHAWAATKNGPWTLGEHSRPASQGSPMLLISSLVAGTFVLATSFSLIAVLTD
jgi:hypothetical protein